MTDRLKVDFVVENDTEDTAAADDDDDDDDGRASKKCRRVSATTAGAVYQLDGAVMELIKRDKQNDKLWEDALTYVRQGQQVTS